MGQNETHPVNTFKIAQTQQNIYTHGENMSYIAVALGVSEKSIDNLSPTIPAYQMLVGHFCTAQNRWQYFLTHLDLCFLLERCYD